MIELLAVTDDPRPPAPPVRAVEAGALTILYVPAGDDDGELAPEELWRREERLEELMEERTVLPVRLGTRVADERAAVEALATLAPGLRDRIEHVRGAVELAVRSVRAAAPARGGAPREPDGREYLHAKAEEDLAARHLHAPLAALSREDVLAHGGEGLRGAYLVDRERVDEFVALVRRLQDEHPELDLLCTGPWPPYSFARGTAAP